MVEKSLLTNIRAMRGRSPKEKESMMMKTKMKIRSKKEKLCVILGKHRFELTDIAIVLTLFIQL